MAWKLLHHEDMRVLIADDERDVGRSLAELVRFCNHQIVGVVASGLEAIQAYNRYHPDVVLMDYRMPKLNGATACRNIFSKDPAARIILVSGWSPSDEASASGAIAMLPKPVSLEQLQAALQSVAETLPALSPAEMPIPEISSQQDSLDYFQPVPQPLAVVPPSLEMGLHVDPPPNDQPDSIDYFQPVPQPLPVVPPSEMSFHVDTFPISAPVPQNELQPIMNAGPPNGKKNRRRRNARGTQRSGVR